MLAAVAGTTPRIPEGDAHPNGAICRTLVQLSAGNVRFNRIAAPYQVTQWAIADIIDRFKFDFPAPG
jgi:hypothetical protein